MRTIRQSPQRRRVYDFIVQYKAANDGNSPTIREVAQALGYRTVSAVHYHLRALETDGLIELEYGQTRRIRVSGARWVPPAERAAEGAK